MSGNNALAALLRANKQSTTQKRSLADVIRERRALEAKPVPIIPERGGATGMHGELITYNKEQADFIELIASGESCVLVGAAGTGKTTSTQGGISALIAKGNVPVLQAGDHTKLVSGSPGIVIVAYTRRAVSNIERVLPPELKGNCLTVHKLLEYRPKYEYVYDEVTGNEKRTMRFAPSRDEENLLPSSIHTILVEESSMLSTMYFNEIKAALGHSVQWVFVGDIQQLPPVFGPAILGFAMLKVPVVELTQVYRQALESPIIKLAHRVLSGSPLPLAEFPEWKIEGKLTLHPWKKPIRDVLALANLAKFFTQAIGTGVYDPEDDMVLMPYNKGCGTLELNKHIANYLARKNGAITYEVVAGFSRVYFSVGDKVLYDKADAVITGIFPTPGYTGAEYKTASKHLDYWGVNQQPNDKEGQADAYEQDVDLLLASAASADSTERVTKSSHTIHLTLTDTGDNIDISSASDINNLLHAYALTVHKAQGSEWRKVFLAFHHTHANMIARELIYTAVTRAREELYIICEPETLVKGIVSQRIKGATLLEKAEFFKGKATGSEHHYTF